MAPFLCFVRLFLYVLYVFVTTFCWTNNAYSWNNLPKIEIQSEQCVTTDFLHSHKITEDIARTPGSLWITIPAARRRRWRRERKQKQGSRAGALMRLCKEPHKPLLPSICLTNTTSRQWAGWAADCNKQDCQRQLHSANHRDLASLTDSHGC